MFFSNLFPNPIGFYVAVIATAIIAFVFFKMSVGYTQKRAYKRYAQNKEKAPSIPSFTTLSKVLFVVAMVLTVLSYWWQFPSVLLFHDAISARLLGALFVSLGYFGLKHAFTVLDTNYSPLFDAYKPFSISTSGIYSYIRHPIYFFNLCVSFGLALSSGLFPVLLTASIGFIFVMRALLMEEKYLKQHFPEYRDYCLRTWRFIPYVF